MNHMAWTTHKVTQGGFTSVTLVKREFLHMSTLVLSTENATHEERLSSHSSKTEIILANCPSAVEALEFELVHMSNRW